jgi:hypothetical protein
VLKAGGWDWESTRITAPDRAARQWVVLAVATLWLVEVGGLAESEPRAETVPPLPKLPKPPRGQARVHRLFRVGLGLILAGIITGRVPVGRFTPDPWPTPVPVPVLTEEEFIAGLTYL